MRRIVQMVTEETEAGILFQDYTGNHPQTDPRFKKEAGELTRIVAGHPVTKSADNLAKVIGAEYNWRARSNQCFAKLEKQYPGAKLLINVPWADPILLVPENEFHIEVDGNPSEKTVKKMRADVRRLKAYIMELY